MHVRATAILAQTEDFRVGYETGLAGGMCIDGTQRFKLDQPVTEELIVEIIRNLTDHSPAQSRPADVCRR